MKGKMAMCRTVSFDTLLTVRIYVLFCCCLRWSIAFNLDTVVPIVKHGNRNSYFGFSIAQHFVLDQNRNVADSVVIVGAPIDNITHSSASEGVRGLVRPGAVYKCPFTSHSDDCDSLAIDLEEPVGDIDKTDQWMGASVSSQGTEDGKAVACAHRYRKTGSSYVWGFGICISMSNSLDEEDDVWEPCAGKSTDLGHGEYGFCQAGISSAISQDGELLLGAPGSCNWRGNIFKNIMRKSLTEDKQWFQSPVEEVLPNAPAPQPPQPATGYYAYLGMSVKVCNIINGRKTYVAGSPRSKDSGQVLLFEPTRGFMKVEPHHYLTGEQFGSGFGYDISVIDLNSDGKEDLVVGAPFEHGRLIGGAIYVYMNGPQGITKDTKPIRIASRKMNESECSELDCQNARFGFALSSIGDVDRDGFGDLAVGAPFEGHGAVYIFRGSASGIIKEYSQRIYASDLPSIHSIKTFGYSLSGGQDMDFNGYPDLVVGAYKSDKIVMLRTRPVININATITSSPSKIDPKIIECAMDGEKYNCFQLDVCFKYSAEPKERFTGKRGIDYKIEAEKFAGAKLVRVFFKGTSKENGHVIERTISLNKQNVQQCKPHVVYIIDNNKDFLNPIKFQLSYKLPHVTPPKMTPGITPPDINEYPILNEAKALLPLSVNFVKNCAQDSECLSSLEVKGELKGGFDVLDKDGSGDYVLKIGQDDELKLDITVSNSEEEAHEAMLYITLPESLVYRGTDDRGKQYSCYPDKSIVTANVIVCSIGNPLSTNKEVKFAVRLDPSKVVPTMQKLNISLLVNTTSKETNILDDVALIKMKAIVETDLEVRGQSSPSEVFFSGVSVGESAIKFEEQIGTEVIHSYEVKNLGGGRVASSVLTIYWPYEKEDGEVNGKHLLYLMDPPKIDDGQAECIMDEKLINPRKIIRQEKKTPVVPSLKREATAVESKSRQKRSQGKEDFERTEDGRYIRVVNLDCDAGTAKCFNITCNIVDLAPGQSVVVRLRSRLWNSTFLDDYTEVGKVRIYSKARINIDAALNIEQTTAKNDMSKAFTIVQPSQDVQKAPSVELWIIILAVCAGVILLLLLILLLWQCGFFKREKPDDMIKHKAKLENQSDYAEYYHD